jgi:hypothetical protein
MGRKRRTENTTPQKANDNIIEDLMKSEGHELPSCCPQKNDDRNIQGA